MAHAAAVGARVEVGAKERQGSSGGVRYYCRQLASRQIICRGEWSKRLACNVLVGVGA